jgi:hypothetical protein
MLDSGKRDLVLVIGAIAFLVWVWAMAAQA